MPMCFIIMNELLFCSINCFNHTSNSNRHVNRYLNILWLTLCSEIVFNIFNNKTYLMSYCCHLKRYILTCWNDDVRHVAFYVFFGCCNNDITCHLRGLNQCCQCCLKQAKSRFFSPYLAVACFSRVFGILFSWFLFLFFFFFCYFFFTDFRT